MAGVSSFDVFDTVLTRLLGGPRQVFVETGRTLRHDGVLGIEPEAFAAAREATQADLTTDVARHPTLPALAAALADRLGLAPTTAAVLQAAELAVEERTLRAVPGVAARLGRRRASTGRGVLFVSDTPHPQAFLQRVLAREGLFVEGDTLITSAARGASKQDGGLFDAVAADLGLDPVTITHTGDDREADLVHARLHGWRAVLDTRARFTGRERALDRAGVATEGLGPRLAGASRLGRLAAVEGGADPALAGIAGAVALPLLAGYGLWVLAQAQLLGLDRLYFVSRDGEVFREVTERLAAQAGLDVGCHYLYGSRLSWYLAAAGTDAKVGAEVWLPDDEAAESLSPRALLALVDLTPADAHALTGSPAVAPAVADVPVGVPGWARLRALLATEPLAGEIARRARARRDLLVGYLDQEGVTTGGRVGLVDVGWTGRAARSLEDVLLDAGRPLPAAHLFLGLQASAPQRMGPELFARAHGWLLDEARGRPSRIGAEDPVMLIESFAMGREGHTSGYRRDGDRIGPVLAAAENPAAGRWGLEDYRAALHRALEALLDGPPPDRGVDLRPLVWRQLREFWTAPGAAEAAAWGAQPYGEDFGNARTHPLATPVGARRMATRLGVGRPQWREPTYWLGGTVALSPEPFRRVLTAATRGQALRAKLPRVPARLRGEWVARRSG